MFVGFNQNLLLRMQEATPSTLALCGVLAVLLAYGWHERVLGEALRPPTWGGPAAMIVAGGLAMGLTLMTMGGLALIAVPIILLHQYYLQAGQPPPPGTRARRWRWRSWLAWRDHPGRLSGLAAMAIALAVALPWFAMMVRHHGWQAIAALRVPPSACSPTSNRPYSADWSSWPPSRCPWASMAPLARSAQPWSTR